MAETPLVVRELAAKRQKRVSHRRALFLLMRVQNAIVLRDTIPLDDKTVTELLEEVQVFLRQNGKLVQEGIDNQRADAGKDGPLMRPEDWDLLIKVGFING